MLEIYTFNNDWDKTLYYRTENNIYNIIVNKILNEYPPTYDFYSIIPELRLKVLRKIIVRYVKLIIDNAFFYGFRDNDKVCIRLDDNKLSKNNDFIKNIARIKAYQECDLCIDYYDCIIHWTIDDYDYSEKISSINHVVAPCTAATIPEVIYYNDGYNQRLLIEDLMCVISCIEITLKNNEKYLFTHVMDTIFIDFIKEYNIENNKIDIDSVDNLMVEFNYYRQKNHARKLYIDYNLINDTLKYYE